VEAYYTYDYFSDIHYIFFVGVCSLESLGTTYTRSVCPHNKYAPLAGSVTEATVLQEESNKVSYTKIFQFVSLKGFRARQE
jgi:hypothetical protein